MNATRAAAALVTAFALGVAALCAPCAAAAKEAARPAASAAAASAPASAAAKAATVDLNSADLAALRALDGISEERASAIIKGRPYRTPEDLVNRRILPRAAFDRIKNRLVALGQTP